MFFYSCFLQFINNRNKKKSSANWEMFLKHFFKKWTNKTGFSFLIISTFEIINEWTALSSFVVICHRTMHYVRKLEREWMLLIETLFLMLRKGNRVRVRVYVVWKVNHLPHMENFFSIFWSIPKGRPWKVDFPTLLWEFNNLS